MSVNAERAMLVPVRDGEIVAGDRVAAHPTLFDSAPTGLFLAFPGEPTEICRPVYLVGDDRIPVGVVAVSETLASTLGLIGVTHAKWELRTSGFSTICAQELCLELTMDQPLDRTVVDLSRSADLDRRLLYASAGQDCQGMTLEVDGSPFRVHRLHPEAINETVFYVSEQTALTVFAPSHRAGIDVVILADCSGSMGVEDLTEVTEAAPPPSTFRWFRSASSVPTEHSISRIRALQRALTDLLERRLQIVGSASRIALIAFGDRSELRFPRAMDAVKMIEFDGSTPPELVRQFRDTIATLRAENWNTNIGQALQFAAAHISEYGKPDNERLIVLISDGADWRPRGDDAAGELVNAMDEPVSLMEHLHESMNIHLHAIGISTSDIYDQYLRRRGGSTSTAHVGHRPNHTLLTRLVEVGGGDPTRTGDAGVLEEYLQGLGTGVTRSVRIAKGNKPPRAVSDAELKQILAFRVAPQSGARRPEDRELVQLRERLRRQYQDCNRNCLVHLKFRLFNPSPEAYDELFEHVIHIPAASLPDYCYFINQLHKVFDEGVAEPVRRWTRDQQLPAVATQIAEILHDEPFDRLSVLRHKLAAHDAFRGSGADAATKLACVLEQLVGVKIIARDDAAMWLRLQKATLELLSRILDQILAVFENREPSREGDQDSAQPIIRW